MKAPRDAAIAKWQLRAYKAWAVVGMCAVAGIVLYVCGVLWQAVATVILTAFIVFLLHHFVARLQKRGIPRAGGVLIAYIIILLVLCGVLVSLVPAIAEQARTFTGSLPEYMRRAQDFIAVYLPQFSDFLGASDASAMDVESTLAERFSAWTSKLASMMGEQAPQLLQGVAGGLVGAAMGVGNGLLVVFIAFICAAWILIDLPTLSCELRPLFGEDMRRKLGIVSSAFGTAIYGWMKSTIICAVITGVLSALAFWALGIPYSALLGLICAVLYLVPYIGPFIAGVITAVVALIAGLIPCVLSIVANGVIGFVVGNIISPRLMQSSVNVHPTITLVAILVGGALGGAVGMLLSIPIAAALQGIFVAFYEARTGKKLGTPDGALFRTPTQAKMPHIHGREHGRRVAGAGHGEADAAHGEQGAGHGEADAAHGEKSAGKQVVSTRSAGKRGGADAGANAPHDGEEGA